MAFWVLFTSSCNCLPCSQSFSNGDRRSLQFFFSTFEYQINALFCSGEQWTDTREQQPLNEEEENFIPNLKKKKQNKNKTKKKEPPDQSDEEI